ncbi:MAG TPA: thioredoxin domain-containing protein [Tenuifilaceae bacterium]|nr:thioredoxin domain-containing protein [Tenuifilaceae bacterium]
MKKLLLSIPVFLFLALSLEACNGNSAANPKTGGDPKVEGVKNKENAEKKYVKEITRADFLAGIMDYTQQGENVKYLGDKPAIVDFWASWCGPCRIAGPILEELAKEYDGKIVVYKVNTQNEQQIASELGIQSIPTFIFFPLNGKPFASSGIARTPEETKKMFKDIIDKQLLNSK